MVQKQIARDDIALNDDNIGLYASGSQQEIAVGAILFWYCHTLN